MSQPKRFDFWMYQKETENGQWRGRMEIEFSEHGRCVSWDDYAALAAENERLRKAGDAMRDCVDSDTFPNTIAAWNAAKEGRDA